MMNLDTNAKYTVEHEWARKEGDLIVCGITDHAQDALGDIVFVEMPEVGDSFAQNDVFGVVESVKAANDLFIPMSGEIVEINESLEETPEFMNENPYGEGWILKFRPSKPNEWNGLLSGEEYKAVVEEELAE